MEHVGIAKTVRPDLRSRSDLYLLEPLLRDTKQRHELCPVSLCERIVTRNRVGLVVRRVDIDAKQLAPQPTQILAGIKRVAFPAGIALADVQFAVRSKGNHAAVV